MDDNKEQWKEVCQTDPSVSIYNNPWWLDAVCADGEWGVLLSWRNAEVVGALPYYIKKKAGMSYITQPPLTQFNGIWLKCITGLKREKALSNEQSVMEDLINQLSNLGTVYYQQNFSPRFKNWLPFYWSGFSQTTRYTYVLDSSSRDMEDITAGYSRVIRYDIKQATKTLRIAEDDDLEAFYGLYEMTFARQGKSPGISFQQLCQIENASVAHHARKMLFARDASGNNYCAVYLVYDSSTVYYLLSGTDNRFRKANALSFVLDDAIRFANETGKDFDFEGSMVKGINDYFRKFGSKQTPYYSIKKTTTSNPIIRLAINSRR